MSQRTEKYWHESFEIAVFIKAVIGFLEFLSAVTVLTVSPKRLEGLFLRLGSHDLPLNLDDFFLWFAHQYIGHLNSALRLFSGLYLLSRALINLCLVVALIKEKAAAYLVAMGVIGAFMFYQIFRVLQHHSLLLAVLTFFDAGFLFLIWHEHNRLVKLQRFR